MVAEMETAPDLKRGFIVNGMTAKNAWSTEIQCVLTEIRDGKAHDLYLSHQCRREDVPFSSGRLGGKERIFQLARSEEFLTFTRDGAFYQLTDLDSVVPASKVDGIPANWDGGSHLSLVVNSPDWHSEVVCERTPIRVLSFDEALTGLVEKRVPMRDLFLRVSWSYKSMDFQLHCPCRYINFSNPLYETNRYLQPISGYVLVPIAGTYSRGYVACARDGDGTILIELLTPRYHSPYADLAAAAGGAEITEIMKNLNKVLPAVSRSFDVVRKVAGCFDLFVYDDPKP